ncbi:virulence-associated protein E, partial [Rhodobacteraceae bacterium R_SAG10]|nr:virulence-associated protein E [Rhodobacteraceae bacterium R_SAG10]
MLYCFKGACSFRDIVRAANLPADSAQFDNAARKETERKQAEYTAAKLAKARSLWDAAKPIAGTKAEAYLRGRGITAALPDSLRFMPDIY